MKKVKLKKDFNGNASAAKNIRNLRLKLKMNQAEFSRAIGINFSSVSHYEAGRRKPGSMVCQQIKIIAQKAKIKITGDYLRGEE